MTSTTSDRATTTEPTAATPRVVHVVAKTHLDCGFTDLAAAVVERYVDEFFPRAIAVADELREHDDDPAATRFVWTTGSWILRTALDRSRGPARRSLEEAIERGDLAWHALPVTTHTELADPEVMRWGLGLSAELDDRFGRRTIAGKLTDVPGHTIGLVPLLAAAGVRFLHIGVNPASSVPLVPPVFRWRDDPSGAEVVVMYRAGGYGGDQGVPGHDQVLAFAHTEDNGGPQSADTVRRAWALLHLAYPEARLRAATLSDYAAVLTPDVVATLPVVTSEIGDTWIHGVASDPTKVARLRALQRAHRAWRGRFADRSGDGARADVPPWLDTVSEQLLLVCEHTWGLDEKTWFSDVEHYAPADLARVVDTPPARLFASSWAEQRAYLDVAEAAVPADLHNPPGATTDEFSAFLSQQPAEKRRELPGRVSDGIVRDTGSAAAPLQVGLGRWVLTFDHATGAVVRVVGPSGTTLDRCELGRFWFESFDEADYRRWYDAYNVEPGRSEGWAELDFTKPGIDAAGARSGRWSAVAAAVGLVDDAVVARLTMPGEALDGLGCPRDPWVRWQASADALLCSVGWSAKPASRLPEASWCSFRPDPTGTTIGRWELHKLGRWVDPRDVVSRGNRALHAVQDGARAFDRTTDSPCFTLEPFDTALVAPGRPSLLRFDDTLPDAADGVHALLHDNVWGTNFPMWWGGPFAARFVVRLP